MPFQLSFGRMDKFESCAALYAANYVEKLPQLPSFLLESGKRAHAFLDLYLGHLERHELPSDPSVVDDMVRAAFVDDHETLNSETFMDVLIVARIFANRYRHDFAATIGREEWLERYLDYDDVPDETLKAFFGDTWVAERAVGTKVVGRYDRLWVDGDIAASDSILDYNDYKTGWSSELTTSNTFQGEVYTWMGSAQYPAFLERIRASVYFVRSNTIKRGKVLKSRDLDDVERRLRVIRARIMDAHIRGAFPASPGWHCAYCPVSVKCAKRNAVVNANVVIDDDASARVALGDVLVMESALKARREQLREYTKRAAPVTLEDGTTAGYGRHTSIVVRDVKKLVATIGFDDAAEYLSVNNKKTKKLQNDDRTAPLFIEEHKAKFDVANRAAMTLPAGIGGDRDDDE